MTDIRRRTYWLSALAGCVLTAVLGGPAPHTAHPAEWHTFHFFQGVFPVLMGCLVLAGNWAALRVGPGLRRPRLAALVVTGLFLVPVVYGLLKHPT